MSLNAAQMTPEELHARGIPVEVALRARRDSVLETMLARSGDEDFWEGFSVGACSALTGALAIIEAKRAPDG